MRKAKPCSRADARQLVVYAEAYLATARDVRDSTTPGADHVATGNAVLAAVAASDAICGWLLGERSRGSDHRDAVRLLRTVRRDATDDGAWAGTLADALMDALDSKDDAHYGVAGLGTDAQKRAVRAAERLVKAARDLTRR